MGLEGVPWGRETIGGCNPANFQETVEELHQENSTGKAGLADILPSENRQEPGKGKGFLERFCAVRDTQFCWKIKALQCGSRTEGPRGTVTMIWFFKQVFRQNLKKNLVQKTPDVLGLC